MSACTSSPWLMAAFSAARALAGLLRTRNATSLFVLRSTAVAAVVLAAVATLVVQRLPVWLD